MVKGKQSRRQKHVPQRSCIICRQKTDKRRLTRIVKTLDDGVVVDPTGKRNGRGAYVCDQSACWEKLTSNAKWLNQALQADVSAMELAAIMMMQPIQRDDAGAM